eukprot:scpid99032/ scgid30290/ 
MLQKRSTSFVNCLNGESSLQQAFPAPCQPAQSPVPRRPAYVKAPPSFSGDSAQFKDWAFAMDLAIRSLDLQSASATKEINKSASDYRYATGFQEGNVRLWVISSLEANVQFNDWPVLRSA